MAAKLQITITEKEEQLLAQKASALGYDVTKFVKFLISREAYKQVALAKTVESEIEKSIKEYKRGKYKSISNKKDIKDYVNSI